MAGAEEGLETYYGNALSEHTLENLDLSGIGRMLAMTANNEINSLASLTFPELFSRAEVYQLATDEMLNEQEAGPKHLRGRFLFDKALTYNGIADLLSDGATVELFKLDHTLTVDQYLQMYHKRATPLFVIDERAQLIINTVDNRVIFNEGQTIISLVSPPSEEDEVDVVKDAPENETQDALEAITHEIISRKRNKLGIRKRLKRILKIVLILPQYPYSDSNPNPAAA